MWVKNGSPAALEPVRLLQEGLSFLEQNQPLSTEQIRILAVLLKMQGVSEQIICSTLNVSPGSIYRWQKLVKTEGWKSLTIRKGSKKTKTISEEVLTELKQVINQDPKTLGYLIWDKESLQDLLKTRYHISCSLSVCQKLLSTLQDQTDQKSV